MPPIGGHLLLSRWRVLGKLWSVYEVVYLDPVVKQLPRWSAHARDLTGADECGAGGTIDGNGQVWYDEYAANIFTLRPVLVGIDGLRNSVLSDLVLRYSPQYYHFVANASNVVFNNIDIAGASVSNNSARNTDGWDTYRSRDVTIMNSVINNSDGESNLGAGRMRVWT